VFIEQNLYQRAFQAYLRKGTPIEWFLKQERPTLHYIWRTRDDENVRSSHAANNGLVFAWDDPPATGHPGADYGCRCTAEPYDAARFEPFEISIHGINDSPNVWGSREFVRHYFHGDGREVSVRETGNLGRIVERYMVAAEDGIKRQIAKAARETSNESFSDDFVRTYDMTDLVFSVGDTTIGGSFVGRTTERGSVLELAGEIQFYLRDEFADPLDIGLEVVDVPETIFENLVRPLEDQTRTRFGLAPSGPQKLGVVTGEPYVISDNWSGRFVGQVNADARRSAIR